MGNSETFDTFVFCFNYVTLLSFESMFTEDVNLKCNMSTDMYYFTFFVTENTLKKSYKRPLFKLIFCN